jgi:hypothetical protein
MPRLAGISCFQSQIVSAFEVVAIVERRDGMLRKKRCADVIVLFTLKVRGKFLPSHARLKPRDRLPMMR